VSDKRKKKRERRPEDLEETQTESSWQPSPGPEGPDIERPEGGATPPTQPPQQQPQEPLELGPFEGIESGETDTDVLRVGESFAVADEPVSHAAAAPDPAPGTQPSLSSSKPDEDSPKAPEEEDPSDATSTQGAFPTKTDIFSMTDGEADASTRTDIRRVPDPKPDEGLPKEPAEKEPADAPADAASTQGAFPTKTDVFRAASADGPTRTDVPHSHEPDSDIPPTRTDPRITIDSEGNVVPSTSTRVLHDQTTDDFENGAPFEGELHAQTTEDSPEPEEPPEVPFEHDAETESVRIVVEGGKIKVHTSTHSVHEEETVDFDELHPAEETRTDLNAATGSDPSDPLPVPLSIPPVEEAPEERGKAPKKQKLTWRERAEMRRRRKEAWANRRKAWAKRIRDFFSPKKFIEGTKKDVKAFLAAWKTSGERKTADLKVDKNADWWRRTLLETAALFCMVVPVEMVAGKVGSFGLHPHPYWLIVLPMAGARGVVAGMVAAAIASVLYVIGAFQSLGTWDLFTYRIMTEPMLFFGVGFFAGELHDELALRHRKVSRKLEELKERNKSLREQRDVLADANKLIERRIVDQSVQFGNLVVAARRIESADRSEVFHIALDLVEEHCGAAASVLLLLPDGGLDYLCHRGWPDDEQSERLGAARLSSTVQRAIDEGKVINGLTDEETPPEGEPLVVAPLFDSNGLIKALLCLDVIPASRLNPSTITTFYGISEWLGAALARLDREARRSGPSPVARSGPGGEVWMGSPPDLGERLRLELERCARYGVATSFLAIQAPEYLDTTREGTEILDRYVCMHFTHGMRPSDTLYKFGYPGCYLLVLGGTNVDGAEVVRTRLLRRVDYASSETIGPIEIFATGPDADAPDLLSLAERVASRFRAASPLSLDGNCPIRVPKQGRGGEIDEFVRRLRMETSLATRNGFDMHVIGLRGTIETADPELVARHVREVGENMLRPTDGVFSVGPNQCAVILPCTGADEATTVGERLVAALRDRDTDAAYGDLEMQLMALGKPHTDAASFLQSLAHRGDQSHG